ELRNFPQPYTFQDHFRTPFFSILATSLRAICYLLVSAVLRTILAPHVLTININISRTVIVVEKEKPFHKMKSARIIVQHAAGSVSRLRIELEVVNKGSAQAELVRHLAPVTCSAILKGLPLQDRVHRYADKFVY